MPGGPDWKRTIITLPEAPDEPQTLYYRDIAECVAFLFGNPTFSGDMTYRPGQVYENEGKTSRVFHEMWSGDAWKEAQVSAHFFGGYNH